MEYTQIIATISPTSGTKESLREMIQSGLDIARLNFSHGTYVEHEGYIKNIREVAKKCERNVPIIQDLCGPKIRTGEIAGESIILKQGDNIILTEEEVLGNTERLTINYPDLAKDIEIGHRIFINDGRLELLVEGHTDDGALLCKIVVGGEIRSKRGVNFPDSHLSVSPITDKDIEDVKFGVKMGVDYIALSFVKSEEDILELKKIIESEGGKQGIIAKIETPEAIKNIDKIISESRAVMVARGDLAVEMGFEKVPFLQKQIVEKANTQNKTVIVATQMMQSMVSSPVPTRAEVSDVANAILDGADCVMLSDETAVGLHPELTVLYMQRIIDEVEKNRPRKTSVKL